MAPTPKIGIAAQSPALLFQLVEREGFINSAALRSSRRTAAAGARDGYLERDYNIAYSRRRFLRAMVDDAELRQMAELDRICFPVPENHDFRTLRMFVSMNGAGLLRWRVPDEEYRERMGGSAPVKKPNRPGAGRRLVAFHLFDCLSAELITLDVHPDWRRRGLARALVSESLAKLREMGHERARCQISIINEPSLTLHRTLGFKVVRLLQNYYGRGRHAFLLTAEL